MPLYAFNGTVPGVSSDRSETLSVPDHILAVLLLTRHRVGRGTISLTAI